MRKQGKGWVVRWREEGRSRGRTLASKAEAVAFKANLEAGIRPDGGGGARVRTGPGEELDLRGVRAEYLKDLRRTLRPTTLYRYAVILDVWETWLIERFGLIPAPSVLSRRVLGEHYDWLTETGLHGRPRNPGTAQKHIRVVQQMWRWAFEDDLCGPHMPRPSRLRMESPAMTPVLGPTWAEMDAVIAACQGPQRKLAIVLRFTGLRVQQAMGLRWGDVDFERGLLTIRGELGKSREERGGRIIPVSPHLLGIWRGWFEVERPSPEAPLLPSNRKEGERERKARGRDMMRGWVRTGVRADLYEQRPHHSFRKGFRTELAKAGARDQAVDFLVGHSRGTRGRYVAPSGLVLEEVVKLIPPLGVQGEG